MKTEPDPRFESGPSGGLRMSRSHIDNRRRAGRATGQVLFLLVLLFAPGRGLIARWKRRARQRGRALLEVGEVDRVRAGRVVGVGDGALQQAPRVRVVGLSSTKQARRRATYRPLIHS